MYEIFKIIILLILLLFFSEFSKVIGGILWFIITAFLRIPYFGKVYHFLFFDRVKILVIFKFVTWIVNASGILLGLVIYYSIFGQSSNFFENLAILLCASGVIVNFLYRVWYLEIIDVKEVFSYGSSFAQKFLGKELANIMESDTEMKTKLMFGSFVDTMIPQFLRILISIGVFYFAAYQLGLFDLKNNLTSQPNLYECIKYAFSFLPIEKVGNSEVAFEGVFWESINVLFGIIIFLWIIVFFNVALSQVSSTIEQIGQSKNEKNNLDKKLEELDNVLGNVFSHFQNLLESVQAKVQNLADKQIINVNINPNKKKKSKRKKSKGKNKEKDSDEEKNP